VHRRFCELLPGTLLWVENLRVVPGEFRTSPVRVGLHVAPRWEEVDGMMARFEEVYGMDHLGPLRRLVASGAAHHRLLWVHPFLDGNGRVARLFSHAYLKEIGVGCELWSVSRGLARHVTRYKQLLQEADEPRQGGLDGRGALSAQGLERFCAFFLETCLDQVAFMGSLLDLNGLLIRMDIWCEEMVRSGVILPGSWPLLREAVMMGEFARGKAPALTGYQDRQARSVLARLVTLGLLTSDTPLGAVRLAFPDSLRERWLPGLYLPAS
jgi:Fic family protein